VLAVPDAPPPKFVVFYAGSDRVAELAPVHFPAHKIRVDEFVARGELLMVGTFADPVADGSMAVFNTREAAERFVADDPFVLHGVVGGYEIKQWNETIVR
jgi:uncharacterized protein YciI